MTEPRITINGRLLAEGQATAVRVAITAFHQECQDPHQLGDDEVGIRLNEAYRDRLTEVLRMIEIPPRQGMPIDEERPAQERTVASMHAQKINRILQLAGIAPEKATGEQRRRAGAYAQAAMSVDEAAVRLQRAGQR